MNIKILALSLLLATSGIAQGQQLREYIGNDQRSEVILDIKALADGGAIMVGYSTLLKANGDFDYLQNDILAIRVDNAGAVVWEKRIASTIPAGQQNASDTFDDRLHRVIVDNNGDFVAVGVVQHYPWYVNSSTPGYAAIFKFDAATGAYIVNFVKDTNSPVGEEPQLEKGSIFYDVVQKDNGELVAVGSNDCRPGFANSMISWFNPATLAVTQNWTFQMSNTDEFTSVAQENNVVYAGGFFRGNTYHDMHMMKIDAANNIVWQQTYDYSTPSGSDNNYMHALHIRNGELLALNLVMNDYTASTECKSGIMRVDMTSGAPLSAYLFNDNGYSHSNTMAADYTSNTNAYYVTNPSNTLQWARTPYTPTDPTFAVADALVSIVNPTNGGITGSRIFLHTGEQAISCLNISGSEVYYAGITRNDPAQPGPTGHDIYFVKAPTGLPADLGDCQVEEGSLDDELRTVTHSNWNALIELLPSIPNITLLDFSDPYNVVMLCEEEPCDILDMTWCSSLANPNQYTFNVDTDPAGANVVWDFGDGSPTVNTTAGTPVNHTYTTPGTYTVCVQQLNAAGQVCDEECIDICVADNGGAQKPGRPQAQSSLLDVSDKNSNLAIGDLYPNPTDGTLNIPVTTQTGDEVTIRIIRMDGVVMYDAKEILEEGRQTLKVNLGNLTPGNYMCEIRDNKTRNTRVFTKQ